MDRTRARVIVTGRVQGVFFRADTRATAQSLGLDGFVRNVPDGTVEAVFEGDRPKVQEAVEWCRHGPPGARVDFVDVGWEEPRGESGFRIAHG